MFASFIDIKKNGEHVAGPKLAAGTAQETLTVLRDWKNYAKPLILKICS